MVATANHVRRQCDHPPELPTTPHEKFDFYSNAIMVAVGHLAKTVIAGEEESERMKAALALIALEKARLRHKGDIVGAREKPGYVCELEPLPDPDEQLAALRAKRARASDEDEAPRRVGRTEPEATGDDVVGVPSQPRGGPPSESERWASARNESPAATGTDEVVGSVRPTRQDEDALAGMPMPQGQNPLHRPTDGVYNRTSDEVHGNWTAGFDFTRDTLRTRDGPKMPTPDREWLLTIR